MRRSRLIMPEFIAENNEVGAVKWLVIEDYCVIVIEYH